MLLDGETYVDCNEAAVRVLKCSSKEQVIGRHPLDFSPERQPDGRLSADKIPENIDVALRQGSHRFEWIKRGLDGEECWFDVSLTAIPVRGRRLLYSVWRNISARKRAEEALKEREKELERKSVNLEEAECGVEDAAEAQGRRQERA